MSSKRIPKVNSLIQRLFGEILQQEADVPADVLITVASVETVPNLRSSTIWLYISPLAPNPRGQEQKREEEVLEALNNQLYDLQGALNRKLKMRPLPRITLKLDRGAEHANTIEKRLAELDRALPEDPE